MFVVVSLCRGVEYTAPEMRESDFLFLLFPGNNLHVAGASTVQRGGWKRTKLELDFGLSHSLSLSMMMMIKMIVYGRFQQSVESDI